MLILGLALLGLLLPVCSFAPGYYCLRRFRLGAIEKLVASIGLSLILIYSAAWVIYCGTRALENGTELQRDGFIAVTGLSFLAATLCRREIITLFRVQRVRRVAAGYLFLWAWTVIILAMIRNYSGLGWGTDWLEHFQRALFFIHHFPVDTPGVDAVPSRPPMMNVLCAFFLAQTSDVFPLFQIISAFLNLLPFMACALMLPALAPKRKWGVLPLVALFAFNPMDMENATYTWTKAFAAFYVLVSFWFYLAARRKRDPFRFAAAFLAGAAGLLVHYSAGPYVVFLAAHYLLTEFPKRPNRLKELTGITVPAALLLSTWFGWSILTYGLHATFQSNTPVRYSREYKGSNLVKIGANIADSVIPWPLRNWSVLTEFDQPNPLGKLRDAAFAAYQTNLIAAMGVVGGPFVLWFLFRTFRRPPPRGLADWRFWRVAIPVCVLAGLAVVGERDQFGTAHLTLIPMELLGVTIVAACFPWKKLIAVLLLVGCATDFSVGVLLQARIESLENSPSHQIFSSGIDPSTFAFGLGANGPESLSAPASTSWFVKHKYILATQYLSEVNRLRSANPGGDPRLDRTAARLQVALQEDMLHFRGWWSRHDYQMVFLGDQVSEQLGINADELSDVLIVGFAVLTALIARRLRQLAAPSVTKPAPSRRRAPVRS